MPSSPRLVPWSARLLALGLVLGTVPCPAPARPASGRATTPLEIVLVDLLPPLGDRPAVNSIDDRRRLPLLRRVVAEAVHAGELPPATVTADPPPDRTGAAPRLTIYLSTWEQTPLGGAADTEVLCRLFTRWQPSGGGPALRQGPFFGRAPRRFAVNGADFDGFLRDYAAAARQAVGLLARRLPPADAPARRP